MLSIAITVLHIVACLFLVVVVLLQTGKGAEMGAVFGGSSSTVFGSSGAGNFLTRLTTATAIVFMLTSLSLTYIGAHRRDTTIFDSAPAANPALPLPAGDEAAPAVPPMPDDSAAAPAPAEPISAPPVANADSVPAPPVQPQPESQQPVQ